MMTAVLYLAIFLFGGIIAVRLLLPGKNPVTRVWLGLSLGMLLLMQLPALCAYLFDFTLKAHNAAVIALLALLVVAFLLRDRSHPVTPMRPQDKSTLIAVLIVCVPLTVLSAVLQHTHMILEHPDGSLWGGQSTYGDLSMHLSFITSMRDKPFPPSYPLLANTKLSYPYLTDSLSTSMLMLGMDLHTAIVVPGTLLMALTYAGYMILARQVLGNRKKALIVCAALFFLNGGLGFLYDFDMAIADGFARVKEIFTGYYKTPANQPDFNLRFSNVIADLLIPQRALLGGWAMGIPVLYLLLSAERAQSMRQTLLLALWASALPLIHTHTFLAIGLFSAGFLLSRLVLCPNTRRAERLGNPVKPDARRKERLGILARAGVYLAVVLALALPQLLGNAIRQTVESGALRFQFNWVNNHDGNGLIDGYFWFWIKNAGLPFLLMLAACFDAFRRDRGDVMCGMACVFVVAELVIFQRNEYDNNKLFYIWYMFAVIIAVDYGSVIMQRLAGLRGRVLLCGVFIAASVLSGSLSIAREVISSYQLYSADAVDAAKWIDENTPRDAVFLTGQEHLNPVCSLAGRQIVCGSSLYVYYHGLAYDEQAGDCQRFYEQPAQNAAVLGQYDVDYVFISDYERADFDVDLQGIESLPQLTLAYENPEVRVYAVKREIVPELDETDETNIASPSPAPEETPAPDAAQEA